MIHLYNGSGNPVHSLEVDTLEGFNFKGMDLTGISFSGMNLMGTKFKDALLCSTYFSGSYLAGASFVGMKTRDVGGYRSSPCLSFGYSNLSDVNFEGCNLKSCYFAYSLALNSNFNNADVSYSDFTSSFLRDSTFVGANVQGIKTCRANLTGVVGINKANYSPTKLLIDGMVGTIQAYKLVTDEYTGIHYPGLYYTPGAVFENMKADKNEDNGCSFGINLATLPWCISNYRPGMRIMRVSFDRSQLACVPYDIEGVIRVTGCRVLEEVDLYTLGLGA